MSDDLQTHAVLPGQGPSWRQPRPSGLDADMRRMLVLAGGVAGVLVLAVGGWSVLGHRQHGIPLIAAPSGPVRVRPLDPGGMQVSGLTDPAMVGDGSDGGTLAPQPETPDPQRLRAQVQAGQGPVSPGVPTVPAAPATTPVPAAPQAADAGTSPPPAPFTATAPAPATPSPARPGAAPALPDAAPARAPVASAASPVPSPRAPAPAVRPEPAPAAATSGSVAVQLAAMDSQAAAGAEWARLSHHMPELLDGRHPDVTRVDHDGRTLFRVRLGGFGDMAQAIGFCAKVRAKGGGCSIAAF